MRMPPFDWKKEVTHIAPRFKPERWGVDWFSRARTALGDIARTHIKSP
jgi:hypothetical protein